MCVCVYKQSVPGKISGPCARAIHVCSRDRAQGYAREKSRAILCKRPRGGVRPARALSCQVMAVLLRCARARVNIRTTQKNTTQHNAHTHAMHVCDDDDVGLWHERFSRKTIDNIVWWCARRLWATIARVCAAVTFTICGGHTMCWPRSRARARPPFRYCASCANCATNAQNSRFRFFVCVCVLLFDILCQARCCCVCVCARVYPCCGAPSVAGLWVFTTRHRTIRPKRLTYNMKCSRSPFAVQPTSKPI